MIEWHHIMGGYESRNEARYLPRALPTRQSSFCFRRFCIWTDRPPPLQLTYPPGADWRRLTYKLVIDPDFVALNALSLSLYRPKEISPLQV